jgi:hypothetical protein
LTNSTKYDTIKMSKGKSEPKNEIKKLKKNKKGLDKAPNL